MIKYIKVFIDETSKNIGNNKEGYRIFNQSTESFATIKDAKQWLSEKYNSYKKVKMYQDKKDGTSYQSGWIYCFKNADISHPWTDDGKKNQWYQQDWVTIKEVQETTIL